MTDRTIEDVNRDHEIRHLEQLIADYDRRLKAKIVVFEKGAVDDVAKLRAELTKTDEPRMLQINKGFRFDVIDV